jgi:glycosyltransferase involved in cell wall biosynthesis
MKVLLKQFLGRNHSWSIVGQNLARQLIQLGHETHIYSTNGIQYLPNDLKHNLIGYIDDEAKQLHGKEPSGQYDLALSYTCIKNSAYLQSGRNRFLIWVYEWPILSPGFAKHANNLTYILAPSKFAADIFRANKIQDSKIKIVPHGIDFKQFENKKKFPLKTKKGTKILVNIGQAHHRKNLDGMFNAYFKAFTKNDDVCLVAKVAKKPLKNPFDVDPMTIFQAISRQYKNAAEVELITDYVPNIVELYNACDIVFTMSHTEGFYIPGLEAIAANKINIAPRHGGQLDFLSDSNALLIDGKVVRAPLEGQYWQGDIRNTHFSPDIDNAVDKLRHAVAKKNELTKKFAAASEGIKAQYTWENAAKQIVALCQ